jgi:predicted phage terminase large subunit-like protein
MEWWELCCSDEKYVAIAAPRGHAKTTAITLAYGLATALFRKKKYIIVVSDTESQACQFLGAWKQELSENQDLIALFGIKKNEKGEVEFTKDTESDFICMMNDGHQFRVQAKGSEQKLRGLLWNGQRPDLVLGDDLENDEIVLNQDRREKFRKWFYGALVPCLSASGQIRIVGTILHADAMLERLMPAEHDKFTVVEELKVYSSKRRPWKTVKYRAHNKDYSKILWPERWSEEKLRAERQSFMDMGLPDVYSREFLNIPIDDSVAYFKKGDFLPMTDDDKLLRMHYYITADLAISEKERSDYSVFVVGGVDEHKRLHIVNTIRSRMDGREIVDTILALQRAYEPECFGIEEGQISKAIGPFLMEEMQAMNVYANIYPMKHMAQDKPMRARAIQARMRAKTVKFDKQSDWFPMLEEEMTRFPRDRHDDQVDAMAWLGHLLTRMVEAPTSVEQKQQEYEDELEKSDYYAPSFDGRNAATGY